MKKLILPFALYILVAASCSKNEPTPSDCLKNMLDYYDMVAYEGQETGCQFFLMHYQYEGKQYFLYNNACTDMLSYPVDCEKNKLCSEVEISVCDDFYANATYLGIVGIQE